MRDLLDKLDILLESRGLAGRKPGDVFKNSAGEEITFNELKLYPETGGRYEPQEMDQVLRKVSTGTGGNIQWKTERTARAGGFAIAIFDGPAGPLYFGFFLSEIKPNAMDNKIPNQVGDYSFAGKAAAKTKAGLSPQDLLTNKLNLSTKDIMMQLSQSLGTDHPLYAVAHHVALGHSLPVTIYAPKELSFTGFRDLFCEILQPIALQNGLFTGNAGEAAQKFLGSEGFGNTLISFDESKNAGLSDSVLEDSTGRHIKISSKGGKKGAEASVKNLVDEVEKVQDQRIFEEYAEVIEIVKNIKQAGQAGAPLMLGLKYGIIDETDVEFVQALKKFPAVPLQTIKDSINVFGKSPSKKIINLALGRNTKNPDSVVLYYHLMAAIAHTAANKVNEGTNFSKAASDILNNGALVQVYTKATQSGDNWVLENFETHYPSESVTGVLISAGKNYSSTDIKGNFTFKILRNNASPEMLDDKDIDYGQEPEPPELATVAKNITDPKVIKQTKVQPSADIGRSKRPKLR